jgi:alpha-beta hydrolase superfamily lysophospholipase
MRRLVATAVLAMSVCGALARAQSTDSVILRGHPQKLRLYGTRGHPPVIVSSGDGGWMHLAPHVAEVLASCGYFVVGFDVKAYLSAFTAVDGGGVRRQDEPADYRALVDFAARRSSRRPILIGVSEGAGLSVLAASDPGVKLSVGGVVGLGLPDVNELGWRWTDTLIYLTHGIPHEPTFQTTKFIGGVAPLPVAMIHSTHDEFVPLREARQVFAAAEEPKRLWVVNAVNHRFSNNLAEFDRRLLEALVWISDRAGR